MLKQIFLTIAITLLASCGGSSGSFSAGDKVYFVSLEGTSLGDGSVEDSELARLHQAPVREVNSDGSSLVGFRVDPGPWIADLVEHSDGEGVPTIKILEGKYDENGDIEKLSQTNFYGGKLVKIDVSGGSTEFHHYTYSFSSAVFEKREGTLITRSLGGEYRNERPNGIFALISGLNGDTPSYSNSVSSAPGLNAKFTFSEYHFSLSFSGETNTTNPSDFDKLEQYTFPFSFKTPAVSNFPALAENSYPATQDPVGNVIIRDELPAYVDNKPENFRQLKAFVAFGHTILTNVAQESSESREVVSTDGHALIFNAYYPKYDSNGSLDTKRSSSVCLQRSPVTNAMQKCTEAQKASLDGPRDF